MGCVYVCVWACVCGHVCVGMQVWDVCGCVRVGDYIMHEIMLEHTHTVT